MPEATAADWAKQNALHEQWVTDNPDAKYLGWVSI